MQLAELLALLQAVGTEPAALDGLEAEQLVSPAQEGPALADRGRALLEHLLSVPLPEQVTVWRVPGVSQQTSVPVERPVAIDPRPPPAIARFVTPQPPTMSELTLAERDTIVRRLTDQGWSQGEIAQQTGLTEAQVAAVFGG
jgi:hypothetical protein